MPKVLWTINAIKSASPEEVAKLNDSQLERLINAARKQVERRIKSIEKGGKYSAAAERLEPEIWNKADKSQLGFADPRVMSRKAMQTEIARHQQFLGSKTSTLKGIKAIEKEQDLRIFGAKTSGGKTPKSTMTDKQRKLFWRAYNEFENRNFSASFNSNRVQTIIMQEMFQNLNVDVPLEIILRNALIRMTEEMGPQYNKEGYRTNTVNEEEYVAGAKTLDDWRRELNGMQV